MESNVLLEISRNYRVRFRRLPPLSSIVTIWSLFKWFKKSNFRHKIYLKKYCSFIRKSNRANDISKAFQVYTMMLFLQNHLFYQFNYKVPLLPPRHVCLCLSWCFMVRVCTKDKQSYRQKLFFKCRWWSPQTFLIYFL